MAAKSSKKSSSRKYGKAAGKSVESAVRREKKGTLRSGKGGKGGSREESQAGDRDWSLPSTQEGCQSSRKKELVTSPKHRMSLRTSLQDWLSQSQKSESMSRKQSVTKVLVRCRFPTTRSGKSNPQPMLYCESPPVAFVAVICTCMTVAPLSTKAPRSATRSWG